MDRFMVLLCILCQGEWNDCGTGTGTRTRHRDPDLPELFNLRATHTRTLVRSFSGDNTLVYREYLCLDLLRVILTYGKIQSLTQAVHPVLLLKLQIHAGATTKDYRNGPMGGV